MTDTLTVEARSERMALVKYKNTRPELVVRRLIHRLGYRFRLHSKDLPGRPDIVMRTRQKVIFVHGCFWHRHADPNCRLARLPKSRPEFWIPKLTKNAERDAVHEAALRQLGWEVLVVWECELGHTKQLENKLISFIEGRSIS